jgi:hypothetical protein
MLAGIFQQNRMDPVEALRADYDDVRFKPGGHSELGSPKAIRQMSGHKVVK